ncbi:RpiR family transcriptional regulator [Pseudoalteromonas sp. HM-SA03]|uniref:MurR/RpiR family transcriptional regulator n=1 Tax=Pseudoalteromonas sp. HM-SA03 TaxID=2029678 RepID=UPI000BAE4607|nr:MurR/RpiR family transcriptional regulator [Pseudoalteromonas sp. HM-SA03]PAX99868.1 RpiR family transcriptional regulator [Pseudoalteromonas sp. HM-SA03]
MSTFVKIKALRPSLSNSEAKLADFTLNSGDKIRALSSVELAREAGVSQSSVVKFAQKLGYKGFPAFKLAVVDALNEQTDNSTPIDELISSNDSIELIADKLQLKQQNVISETRKLNSAKQFENAIQLVKNARKVIVCALGSTFTMAQDLTWKLQKLGIPAIAQVDEISASSFIATMGKDDLFIVISNTGTSKSLLTLTNQALDNGCKCLAISRYGSHALAEMADAILYCINEGEPLKHSGMLSRTSQAYLIDVLFTALAQSNLHWQKRVDKANENMQVLRSE